MSPAVFVDTSVLIQARDAGDPGRQRLAAAWLEKLWVEQRGRTSIQVLDEYYLAVTRHFDPGLAPDEALEDVRSLFAWDPQPIDGDLLLQTRAVEQRFELEWRDSMIVAAAQLQNCPLLLTDVLQDGLSCDAVTMLNPFLSHVGEAVAHYSTTPLPVSRHRPPGRPHRKVEGI